MKIVKLNQTYQHKNAENCVATEYDFADKAIDFSTARIVGDYPNGRYCVNQEVKELVYVISGEGTILFKDLQKAVAIKQGDAVLIEKDEVYAWRDCNLTVSMACHPAWTPQQHKEVD